MLPDPEDRPTVTVDESSEILGISRGAAFNAVKRGEIPSIRIGRRLLVPTAALLRMLDGEPRSAA
jgi:excisionase family DNA binding protein